MPNRVVHFEIEAADLERAKSFYAQAFGWGMQQMGAEMGDYVVVTTGDPKEPGGINGGMLKRPQGYNGNAFVNYVNVDNVDQAVERAKGLGARVTKSRTAVPGMGWFAMMLDPQGNSFAVWQMDKAAK